MPASRFASGVVGTLSVVVFLFHLFGSQSIKCLSLLLDTLCPFAQLHVEVFFRGFSPSLFAFLGFCELVLGTALCLYKVVSSIFPWKIPCKSSQKILYCPRRVVCMLSSTCCK